MLERPLQYNEFKRQLNNLIVYEDEFIIRIAKSTTWFSVWIDISTNIIFNDMLHYLNKQELEYDLEDIVVSVVLKTLGDKI